VSFVDKQTIKYNRPRYQSEDRPRDKGIRYSKYRQIRDSCIRRRTESSVESTNEKPFKKKKHIQDELLLQMRSNSCKELKPFAKEYDIAVEEIEEKVKQRNTIYTSKKPHMHMKIDLSKDIKQSAICVTEPDVQVSSALSSRFSYITNNRSKIPRILLDIKRPNKEVREMPANEQRADDSVDLSGVTEQTPEQRRTFHNKKNSAHIPKLSVRPKKNELLFAKARQPKVISDYINCRTEESPVSRDRSPSHYLDILH
jgi:hypothetical protein